MYRRVITTVEHSDGTSQSTAQDFIFDKSRDGWFEKTGPFEYYGPGVGPVGARGRGNRGGQIGDLFDCAFEWGGGEGLSAGIKGSMRG